MADTTENKVTKPLLLNETGQQIAEYLGIIASKNTNEIISDWSNVRQLVKNGQASKMFNIGDIFTEDWTDTANNDTKYSFDWRVNNFENDYDVNGNTFPAMLLESKWTTPFGVQFSHNRAFLACTDGLPAGTYNITIGQTWGSNAVKDKVYQFTLTKDVVKGGKLAGFYSMPDSAPANWRVYSYTPDGITINETVDVTEGSDGTALGTMAYSTRQTGLSITISSANYTYSMNSMQETAYGWNRWKTSALRQWLNSDAAKGSWWVAQDEFDIAPNELSTKDGFLCGMQEDMLKAVRTTQVTTYTNTVQDGGAADITYDRFFPLSMEQMYINPQISGEGEANEYYKLLNGTDTKYQQYQTYTELKRYSVENHVSSQYVRLRSALRGYASHTWSVYTSGNVGSNNASSSYRLCPACVIG